MRALISELGPGTPLGQLAFNLLSPTKSREGQWAFSSGLIAETLSGVLGKRSSVDRSSPQEAKLRRESIAEMVERPVHLANVGEHADTILGVAEALEETSGVTATETMGQCLWRHRDASALQGEEFRDIVEDVTWVEGSAEASSWTVVSSCTTVFRELTRERGGRMTAKTWGKAMELMKGNPIIRPKVNRNDVHRVFHREAMREVRERGQQQAGDGGFAIGISRFLALLLDMAELMQVHAFMVFFAVGSHADQLVAERRQREEAAATVTTAGGLSAGATSRPGSRHGTSARGNTADTGAA